MTSQSRAAHDSTAAEYDTAASAAGWHPEALLGLCLGRVRPGDLVLAVGIGTGLCAAPFAAHGLRVWGVDESPRMLEVCRAKGIAERLVEHDLAVRPWPFGDAAVAHVLAAGVTHFLPDLGAFVAECARVMSDDGVLAITTRLPRHPVRPGASDVETALVGGVPVHAHAPGLLAAALADAGLVAVAQLDVLLGADDARDVYRLTVAVRARPGVRDAPEPADVRRAGPAPRTPVPASGPGTA